MGWRAERAPGGGEGARRARGRLGRKVGAGDNPEGAGVGDWSGRVVAGGVLGWQPQRQKMLRRWKMEELERAGEARRAREGAAGRPG